MHDIVYSDFIIAATGQPPPTFDLQLCLRGTGQTQDNQNESNDNDPSGNDNDNNNNNSSDDTPHPGQWSIIPEIGDGACLLRCVSRRVHNTPDLHRVIRADIITHISKKLHTFIPGSGFSTFHYSISAGLNIELVQVAGSPPATYSSVQGYLQFMSQPYAYATNIELVAATQLYGLEFRITYHGQPYPTLPLQTSVMSYITRVLSTMSRYAVS